MVTVVSAIIFAFSLCNCFGNGLRSGVRYANQQRHGDYDYIIVGAGSSGSVIANRLSENPDVTVLLLEAGGPPPVLSEIPLFAPKLQENNQTDWGYYTEPQIGACLGLEGQRSFWTRYKALGGCSSHNFMVYARGNHKDYDHWAQIGSSGWSWEDVEPFFRKAENNTDPKLVQDGYHGIEGYLTVSSPHYENELRLAYMKAGKYLGYDQVDYNGPAQKGFSVVQSTTREGLRCSTEKAYLRPAANRPNLDILIYARVTEIEFDNCADGTKRASRVVYYYQNRTGLRVHANKEIILSAGAIGSAQLLLLSGIGPKEDLQKIGIPVISNLPVGLNLQDHILIGGQTWKINDSVGLVPSRDVNDEAIAELTEGKGFLTSTATFENVIFVDSKYQDSSENWPDIQLITSSYLGLASVPDVNVNATAAVAFLTRPKSRGYLKLRSKDPYEHPIIDPKYLSENDDLLRIVEGMKFVREMIKTPALQQYGPEPILEAVPGCDGLDWESDDYLICQARSLTYTAYHPCCTNKMGTVEDSSTVLDPELRVKGVTGLRVADASIMPYIITGNLNAACVMIGEKAADMILNGK